MLFRSGWSLHVDAKRHPVYTYNYVDREYFRIVGSKSLPTGRSKIVVKVDYDKPMSGGPATATMMVDGRDAGRVRIERTVPFLFSVHETIDLGTDLGGAVTPAYAPGSEFDGEVREVSIEIR